MSAKLCLEVALRIMGIWYVLSFLGSVTTTIWIFLSVGWNATTPGVPPYSYVLHIVAMAVQFLLGAALIYWAPSVAARFYPSESREIVSAREIFIELLVLYLVCICWSTQQSPRAGWQLE